MIDDRGYFVRVYLVENNEIVYDDLGPFDHFIAEVVLVGIGIDASIWRGLTLVPVLRAVITPR